MLQTVAFSKPSDSCTLQELFKNFFIFMTKLAKYAVIQSMGFDLIHCFDNSLQGTM